jgi:PTH1 family peptidyl-tRNA hydrolase
MKILAGLGNPGAQYERTRHNAGFWFVERLARSLGVELRSEPRYRALAARTSAHGEDLWLVAPQTYMNVSGAALAPLARFYKIEARDVIVAHDELDLPAGSARLKLGGGFAGHNGLRSITEQLGTRDFWRLRIGIGHPGDKNRVHDYVLEVPRAEERAAIDAALARCLDIAPLLLAGDYEAAMRRLHTKAAKGEPAAKDPS